MCCEAGAMDPRSQSAPAVGWGQGSPDGTSEEMQSLDKALGHSRGQLEPHMGPCRTWPRHLGTLEGN